MTERRGAAYGMLAGAVLWALSRAKVALANSVLTLSVTPPLASYSAVIAAVLATSAFIIWLGSMLRHRALLGTTRNGFVYGVASSYAIIEIVSAYYQYFAILFH